MSSSNNPDEAVQDIIYSAIDSVNELMAEDHRIGKSPDTVLAGPTSEIDSLGLINLLVALEDKVEERYQISLNLVDELTNPSGPFSTVGKLIAYVLLRLREVGHE